MAQTYEIPRNLVSLLTKIGPIHEVGIDMSHYSVDVIVRTDDKSVEGFLITRRPIDKKTQVPEDQGLGFRVPIKPRNDSEAIYIFTNTLENTLDYIRQHGK